MRFRILRREKGAPRRPAPVPEPPAVPVPPRAAELENPYGRYYGTVRSRRSLNAEEVLPMGGTSSILFAFCRC